jgi:hypothetical protein
MQFLSTPGPKLDVELVPVRAMRLTPDGAEVDRAPARRGEGGVDRLQGREYE